MISIIFRKICFAGESAWQILLTELLFVRYLPLNGRTANVVRLHHDLDLHFQGHELLIVNISKTVRASTKCSSITFIEVDISHRMGPL